MEITKYGLIIMQQSILLSIHFALVYEFFFPGKDFDWDVKQISISSLVQHNMRDIRRSKIHEFSLTNRDFARKT